ncbi:hypothetical protein Pint_07664 [Pistacia integerrima]|uniref:Uncharacterized protein n=1 Tax=Pistacia integerrima TaxID=434235 RepID=A0ACC0XUU2_9ROSI|nr:hypothetical protein Pint_07664 [Pistacia integerrima]
MASTTNTNSNNPLQIIDEDDDEFDWEAAVREIDVACEIKKPFTSTNLCSTSKQSTLDKFLGKVQFNQRRQQFNEHEPEPESDEKICYVDIDAEAAKTWIYPR